jgi:phosphoribosylamine--glycine ligase
MRVLVVGGGGREHALCWALRHDLPSADIYCAPGNPGTAEIASNLDISATDIDRLADAADAYGIDLTVVGPEQPLALGLADRLRAEGRSVFGPGAAGAAIEASKAFAKEVMKKAGVPTAASRSFDRLEDALQYVDSHPEPLVVKASGLAGGKGAVVCSTRADARNAVRTMLGEGRFGLAGRVVVIEEFMEGEELSLLAITDGQGIELLPPAQDHKRLGEGDDGPNTGGMGAYSPVSLGTPALLERVQHEVLVPTLQQLAREGAPFSGVLYAGLMIGPDGSPRVVEFNCRLGDPEAQVILPLLAGGLAECLASVARGQAPTSLTLEPGLFAVTTVLAARGYPEVPVKEQRSTFRSLCLGGDRLFHAGTARDEDGTLRVAGGRVLNVTAVASSFEEAQARSRDAAEAIQFEGKVFRRDIGWREAARLASRV